MIAYYYRAICADDELPTGWFGVAFAHNKKELFWLIDEPIDPFLVEIKTAHCGGYIRYFDAQTDESSLHEISTSEPLFDSDGWRAPNWDGVLP